ncbi:MAG TPA: ATP-binding protein [Anaerolineales bacterium]|nr:ATP-binding protein [Anaerolineales bacterium]
MKLTPRITLTFVVYAAALLAAVGFLAYNSGRAALRSATISELQSTAIEKQGALEAWVEEKRQDIARLAQDPGTLTHAVELYDAPSGSPEAANAHRLLLEEILPRSAGGEFMSLMVIDPRSGQVVASSDPTEEGKLKEDRPYFLQGKAGPYVENLYYSVALQEPAMTSAAPLRAPDGRLVGVLAGRIDLDEMNAIISRRSGLHESDDTLLVSTSNLFVTQPRFVIDPVVLQRGIHTQAVERCLEGRSGAIDQLDYRGVPAIAVYTWLPERELCLIVKMDQAEAYAPTRSFGRAVAAISALALVAAVVIAVVLARSLTLPILGLQAGVARFGQGDLGFRLPDSSRDELGSLAREFNARADSLAQKDTSLRARAAELEAANRELEAFSYSVSHDLRAPLRAVDGFSRILLEEHAASLDGEARRYLDLVRDNTQKMGHLIDDLLAFSRLGRQEFGRRTVQPANLARQALDQLNGERVAREVEIEIDEMPEALADPVLLRQLYVNLLSNALKFTRKRDPARIHVGSRTEDGKPVYFVQDNGVGFDMAYVGKLFGVFQRLHRAEDYEGTGVGLAIVQRIVHRHGGRVWAEGAVDRGATFSFTLPERSGT